MEDCLTKPGLPSTWVEILRWRASHQPDRCAFRFLDVNTDQVVALTYADLNRRAIALAARLQSIEATGQRVLLVYPQGLEYITAIFGCLYAGMVAVPVYPPHNNRKLPRLRAIVADAGAVVALTTQATLSQIETIVAATPGLTSLQWLATDDLISGPEAEWQPPLLSGDNLVLLQYTSGSTSAPKGVMLTHRNLLHNSSLLVHAFQYGPSTECVTWLPLYHDMGLIGGVFQPLFGGFPNTLMSPLAFLRNPFRWLKAISDYKVSLSGGPNFAYDLCVRRITAEQRKSLDLSHWSVAFTGAEPIRSETLDRFVSTFEMCGFRRRAFFPCYGLAEATLIVSGGPKAAGPTVAAVRSAELAQNRIVRATPEERETRQAVIGCGMVLPDEEVLVVHPDSRAVCGPNEVGEIWVSSQSIARGYWNRPDETKRTFEAKLSTNGAGPFLRTGDLGYLHDSELFVTGRIKDLIIIRGRNLYPQDIELTVETSHAALRPNCGAAFTVEVNAEERLVIVQEVDQQDRPDLDAVIETIRQAVAEEYEVQPYAVALIKPKSIPRTSSGKIQRHASRARYLDGELEIVASVSPSPSSVTSLSREVLMAAAPQLRHRLLNQYLQERIARSIGVAASRLNWEQSLISLGLDSLMAVELQAELESALGLMLPMASFMQASSTTRLVTDLLELLSQSSPAQVAFPARGYALHGLHPLSPGQKGLWFLQQLDPRSAAYNIARAVCIRSELDVGALHRAFQSLVERHDSLRATFITIDGEPRQQIDQNAEACFVEHDATNWSESVTGGKLCELSYRPFDLESGPLLRIHCFKRSAAEHILLLVAHHIIVDFWSLTLMMQELAEFYSAERNGLKPVLPRPSLDYVDYAYWQTERLVGSEFDGHWEYWRQQLSDELPLLGLPVDKPRPAIQTYRGASYSFRIKAEYTRLLKQIGAAQGATLYMALLAAFQILLNRYTDQEEIIVGTSINGRNRSELMSVVGYFVNVVALRTNFSGDPNFYELLRSVRQTVVSAFAHQEYPFTEIVERLQSRRDPSRSPIFQTMFVLQKAPLLCEQRFAALALGDAGARVEVGGMEWESLPLAQRVTQFDLTLMVAEVGDELAASLQYNTDLFESESIARMSKHFERLVEAIVSVPERRVSELELLSQGERQQLLWEWNATDSDYPRERCIHELFAQQVECTPEAVAVSFGAEQLTYAELNARANQLAHYLRRTGVQAGKLVGICMDHATEMVVAVLGVLKAGAAYVPVDPEYPRSLLQLMLDDAGVKLVLTQERLQVNLLDSGVDTVCLDAHWERISEGGRDNVSWPVTPQNLAYVIYTSGSTGTPKGIKIAHLALVNYVWWAREVYQQGESEDFALYSSLSFDLTVTSLYVPLLSGGRVVVYRKERGESPLLRILEEGQVGVLKLTPSHLTLIKDRDNQSSRIKRLIVGGEALTTELAWQIHESFGEQVEIYNEYGPTEATVGCMLYRYQPELDKRAFVPIGRPAANVQIYVLYKHGQVVPENVVGELCISGDGLAQGYLNREALTAEKFVDHPFIVGQKLYRSGDRARLLPEGEIEYLGRHDEQVKFHGYRVELNALRNIINQHPLISDSVVQLRPDERGNDVLIAYYVSQQELDLTSLRQFLAQHILEATIPSVFLHLKRMPLTVNGKINYQALPSVAETRRQLDGQQYMAPQTAVEEILSGIWSEVLGIDRVGATDNFFAIGGHSLLATKLVSRIRGALHVEVTLRTLFDQPTIRSLSKAIGEQPGIETAVASSITRANREQPLPLSFAQQRLWFLDQLNPGSAAYNVPAAARLIGRLDATALERSLGAIVQRHEILRTRLRETDSGPVQVIGEKSEVQLPLTNLSHLTESEREAEARRLIKAEASLPFDLSRSVIRGALLKLSEEEHIVLLTMHHIASDWWSMRVLIRELGIFYSAFTRGTEAKLPELPIQYADYAAWQRDWLQGPTLQAQLDYWKQQLGGALPVLALPEDHPRPKVQTYQGAEIEHAFDTETSRQLKELSRREGVTLFMTLLAAFNVLLARYTRQEDILVGTPVAGRSFLETEGLIGFFVNTLVLRTDLSGNPNFRQLLQRVREVTLTAHRHQDLPFERLVEELQPERDLSHTALFQVMFAFENAPHEELQFELLHLRQEETANETAKFDLIVTITEHKEGLRCGFNYNTDLFEATTIGRMMDHFGNLLAEVLANPDKRVSELRLSSPAELSRVLQQWNAGARVEYSQRSVQELFEEQVTRNAASGALVFGEEEVSYEELNIRANQLAHYLRKEGVGPEVLVGVLVERSIEMVVAVLGVLKAGGAYVPLDLAYPPERLRFTLEDAAVPLLLTQRHLVAKVPALEAKVIVLDKERKEIAAQSAANPPALTMPDNLAYVIYTSGSTGKPKGVQIPHRGLSNFLTAMAVRPGLTAGDVVLSVTTLSFDIAGYELFLPLVNGARVVVASREEVVDGGLLIARLESSGATVMQATPASWRLLLEASWEGDKGLQVLCGGEAMGPKLARQLAAKSRELWNLYGPTETTIWSSVNKVDGTSPVTIGMPIMNTQFYVRDGQEGPVPIGVAGELYIGGDGLARGYLKQPELTAEKFVPDQFSSIPGARLYRTGDLVRYRGTGELEHLGRVDQQVKLRGYRIELGEIEAALLSHDSVRDCVVLMREEANSEQRLVGYVVLHEEVAVTSGELREHLRQRLPEYMVPAVLVPLEALPLTANGKVDRRALPLPEAKQEGRGADWPLAATAVEEVLLGLWQEVLQVKTVRLGDNFFDLGGHSLLATQLSSRVRDAFGVEIALRKLFEEPTVAGLGAHVEQLLKQCAGVVVPPIRNVMRAGPMPLSFAQQRLWFIDQLERGSAFYNLPVAVALSGELDIGALEQTLTEVVRRHEVLRTHFTELNGEAVQVIEAPLPLRLPVLDLSKLPPGEREAEVRRLAHLEAARAFNLRRGPLLRVHLLRLAQMEHVLLFTLHHIITDGWSTGVLIKEVATLYAAFSTGQASPLAELEMQYGHYAAWQREWLQGAVLEEQLSYWRRQLGGKLPMLDLPSDRPRPAVRSYHGSERNFTLGEQLTAGVKVLSRREGVTLFMTLLAAFQTLLYRYTQQNDILIGTAIAGRTHKQTEPLLGNFVNMLVLRTDLSGNPRFSKLLRRVREVSLNAYAHQEVPFEKLVEELQPERSLGHMPLFQVAFGVQQIPPLALELPGLQLSTVAAPPEVGRFELTLWVVETRAGLQVRWSYNTDLFDDSRIEQMHSHYEALLESIVADPEARLNSLNSLTVAEQAQHAAEQQHEASLMTLMNARRRSQGTCSIEVVSQKEQLNSQPQK